MKKLFAISVAFLLAGCSNDSIDENVNQKLESDKPSKEVNSTNEGNVVAGLHYNLDSANRYAIVKCNEEKISEIANQYLENIIKKNKRLEVKNELQETYGFYLTKEIWDTLARYGYKESDVSMGGNDKEINLSGHSPYTDKGLWEEVDFNNTKLQTEHTALFEKAIASFYSSENPQISDVTVTDQGGSFIAYSIKVNYNFLTDQYIYYTVSNDGQKIKVTVDKFGMK